MNIIRDPLLWFAGKPRTEPLRAVLIHWTAGVGDAATFHGNMVKNRKCSVHYYVDWSGQIWQMAPDERECIHAGKIANPWTIGIEVQSPGYPNGALQRVETARGVKRKMREDIWCGKKTRTLEFTAAQTAAIVELVEALCARHNIPRVLPKSVNQRQSKEWAAVYRGVLGHCHVHKTKDDPGPQIFEALEAAGFARVG